MKIVSGEGIMGLLQALQAAQVTEEEKYGEPIPLNEEAITEQKRHARAVDPLIEELQLAGRRVRNAQEALEDEQRLWARNMRKAMPELAPHEEFRVADDQRHYMVPVPTYTTKVKPPAWVTEMMQAETEGQPKH